MAFDFDQQEIVHKLELGQRAAIACHVSKSGRFFAICHMDATIPVYDLKEKRLHHVFKGMTR